jgi:hypothetical protein
MGGSRATGARTSHESHAEAVSILRAIGALQPLHRSWLLVRYTSPRQAPPPRSAVGFAAGKRVSGRLNDQRAKGLTIVAAYVQGKLGDTGRMQAYRLIAEQYVALLGGVQLPAQPVVDLLKMSRRDALVRRKAGWYVLRILDYEVDALVRERLVAAGYIEQPQEGR